MDALKRVTDKLRGENDRLRRMAGDGGGRAEAERSAREAKKKAVSFFGSSTNQTNLTLGFRGMSFDSPTSQLPRVLTVHGPGGLERFKWCPHRPVFVSSLGDIFTVHRASYLTDLAGTASLNGVFSFVSTVSFPSLGTLLAYRSRRRCGTRWSG